MIKVDNLHQLKKERVKRNVWGSINRGKLKIIKEYSGNKILDAGCSRGDMIHYLINQGYDAYGCDLIKDSAWKVKNSNRFREADIFKLPYKDNSFDTIISFEVFEHLEN